MVCANRVVLIPLLICGSFLVGFAFHGQAQAPNSGVPDRAYQLVGEKMEVSKLDWIMLTARVRLLKISSPMRVHVRPRFSKSFFATRSPPAGRIPQKADASHSAFLVQRMCQNLQFREQADIIGLGRSCRLFAKKNRRG